MIIFDQISEHKIMEKDKKKIVDKKVVITGLIGGIFVGFLNGFFGGGGGMIVVPLLTLILGLEEREAHATAILTILPITIASAIVYIIQGVVNYGELSLTAAGFIIGGFLGAILLKKSNNIFLKIMFCVIMILAGIKILI